MKKYQTPTLSLLSIACALTLSACDSDSSTPPAAPTETSEAAPVSSEADAEATQVDHVDAKGAAELLASEEKPVVLDVRTPEEYAEGHIEGSTMIDFKAPDFEAKVAELDRDQTYLIHCRSGRRSSDALPTLKKLGFKHIVHLDGGFNAWSEAGEPVAK